MTDKNNKDKLCAEDLFCAMKEKKITASGLIGDIKSLLDDYFICTAKSDGDKMHITFLNGQEFEVSVKEIK